jgi:hypothetical protein
MYEGPVTSADRFTFTTPDPVVSVEDESMPTAYQVFQNYPNPFNPSTIIKFTLPEQSSVKLEVYNILGERIAQLLNTEMEPGIHQVEFNAGDFVSGTYFYTFTAEEFMETKKMMLIK